MSTEQKLRGEREAFEKWYASSAFDLDRDPIGSRECSKQWEAWQARAALAQPPAEQQAPLGVHNPYFAYSQEGGADYFATQAEALEFAHSVIAEYKKQANFDGEWNDDVEHVRVGVVTHVAAAQGSESEGFDYVMAPLAAPEAAKPPFNGWYCAHCQRGVDASEVTYHEQHTECGRVITDDQPPADSKAGGEPIGYQLGVDGRWGPTICSKFQADCHAEIGGSVREIYARPQQQADSKAGGESDAPSGSGGWKPHAEQMESERNYWRARAQAMYEHQRGEVWYWQGDGEDHLESMAHTLPIVIRAEQLRELLTRPQQQAKPLTDEQCDIAIRDSGLSCLSGVSAVNRALLIGLCRAAHDIGKDQA